MKPLIAIAGKKFSGKTTLAELCIQKYDIPYARFAGPMKEGAKIMGLNVDGPDKDVEALQLIGTDIIRRLKGEDHWVNLLLKNHPDMWETGLVIDDVRYPNEYDALEARGFLMVRCQVSEPTQRVRAAAMGAQLGDLYHTSETALNDPHFRWDLEFAEGIPPELRLLVIDAALRADEMRVTV